jgi:GT2 family glycosyltransferase
MGTRPDDLEACLGSIERQDATGPVLLVAQGVDVAVPAGVDVLRLEDNVGVPGGRDAGLKAIDADVVFFLDDDARYEDTRVVTRVLELMRRRPELAAVSLRIVDEGGVTLRRHVPRIGAGSADRSGPVTTFLGGACAIRRSAYLDVGGYEADFVYAHEELDLAWRVLDGGWTIEYLAEPAVVHPHVPIAGADEHRWWLLGRNRVWLARRRLPHPIDWAHSLIWLAVGWMRARSGPRRRNYAAGWRSGWRGDVERDPMTWATVWRMTRQGRPPLV